MLRRRRAAQAVWGRGSAANFHPRRFAVSRRDEDDDRRGAPDVLRVCVSLLLRCKHEGHDQPCQPGGKPEL